MDSGEEVAGSLVAACDDDAKLLECGKEDVTRQVEVRVIIPGQATVRLGRHHGDLAGSGEGHDDPLLGIERPPPSQGQAYVALRWSGGI